MKDLFPFLLGYQNINTLSKTRAKIKLIALILPTMLFVILFTLLFQILLTRFGVVQLVESSGMIPDYMKSMSMFQVITEIVILAPIVEETAFRGLLEKNFRWFRISPVSISYLLICRIFGFNFYEFSISTAITFVGSLCTLLVPNKKINSAIIILQKRTYRLILIWGGAIAFGLWHYYNFDFNNLGIVTVITTLLPFMINGLLLAYVVAKNGLQWSILLHMANNLWPLIIWL
ncbi:CPBP family glutamic-type intramembrane protease [Chryseobacterium sp. C39-AII1]|uniref:CPBP family glutamic-type intramembrane protease n=1 Tax=Chryseobacterium sp. C39-AII1 TaxID=3080332 RepID=UPI00320ABE47